MRISPRQKKLIPLIAITFFFLAAVGCLTPFLDLHLRSLGLSEDETVIINTAAAFSSILGPPLIGFIAQKKSKYKILLLLSCVLTGLGYTALLIIPKVVRSPRSPLAEFDCPSGLFVERCPNWELCSDSELNPMGQATFRLTNCKYNCQSQQENKTLPAYPLHFCFKSGLNNNFCLVYDPDNRDNSTIEFKASFMSRTAPTLTNLKASQFLEYDEKGGTPPFIDVCNLDPLAPIVVNQKQYSEFWCRPQPDGCVIRCAVSMADSHGKRMYPAPCIEIQGDPALTFYTALGLRIFADLWLVTSFYLLEAVTILSINDFYGLYGRIKFWGAFGMVIFSIVTGVINDYYTEIVGSVDYSPTIFIFDGLVLIGCIVTIITPMNEDKKNRYMMNYSVSMYEQKFCSLEMVFLLYLTILLGTMWGYMETYLHWMYITLGADNLIIGLSIGLPFAVALPFLAVSKNLVRNIGKANLIVFGFLFYAIRYAGLSFVSSAWWTLPFEAMETFTLAVLWIALVAYGQKLVSGGQRLTLQCVLVVLHFCFGRGAGTLIGYYLNDIFGKKQTFRGIAVVSVGVGLLYLLLYHTCIRRLRKRGRKNHPVTVNGGWYPIQHPRPNGDTPAHRPMINDQEDSDNGGFEDGPVATDNPDNWSKRNN